MKTAVDDACRMEHVISDDTLAAIKKHAKDMGIEWDEEI